MAKENAAKKNRWKYLPEGVRHISQVLDEIARRFPKRKRVGKVTKSGVVHQGHRLIEPR
jgi:hypothetical protein